MRPRHATGCCAGRPSHARWVWCVWLLAPMIAGCTAGPFASSAPIGGPSFVAPGQTPLAAGVAPLAPSIAVPGVTLFPGRVIAPIGSEVVLKVSVANNLGRMLKGERIGWTLSNQGVGFLVAAPKPGFLDRMTQWDATPERIDRTHAVSRTSRRNLILTRGTPAVGDDVHLRPGEAWIGVTSRAEGTSRVTVVAPDLTQSNARYQTAQIHWIDAQWQFPAPAVSSAGGSHSLTTTVTRHSDGLPIAGWVIRYWIARGVAAGLGADGAQMVDVSTDERGQAGARIRQAVKTPGTTQVGIQIVRPADLSRGVRDPLIVGSGGASMTWSSASLAVTCTAPAQAIVGSMARFVIDLSNRGDLPAKDVVLSARIPQHLSVLNSTADARSGPGSLSWSVGDLAAAASRRFEIDVRPRRAGPAAIEVDIQAAEGLTARDSASVVVSGRRSLEASLTLERGGQQVQLGETITFQIRLTNRGDAPLTGIVIKDSFSAGLQHASEKSPVKLKFIDLAAGQSHSVGITFRVVGEGQLTQNLVVTADGNVTTTAKNQITAVDPRPKVHPQVAARVTGPAQAQLGETISFHFEIKNMGDVPLTGVVGTCRLAAALDPLHTDRFDVAGGLLTWKIPRLGVGESMAAVVKCRARKIAEGATCRFEVTTAESPKGEQTARVTIVRLPGDRPRGRAKLALAVSDVSDPVRRGDQIVYVISVSNDGNATDRDVVVEIQLPAGLSFVKNGIRGPAQAKFVGQTARFAPVLQLRPGETPLTYRLLVAADAPGSHRVVVRLKSQSKPEAVIAEETTSVVP